MADEDGEEDYLSDKFLFASALPSQSSRSSHPSKARTQNQAQSQSQTQTQSQTYSERRKAALRASEARNLAGRMKSRRAREEESREEGLRVSLFERARREEAEAEALGGGTGGTSGNIGGGTGGGGGMVKALGLMRRMGYREGDALGAKPASDKDEDKDAVEGREETKTKDEGGHISENEEDEAPRAGLGAASQHRKVPLPVDIWTGKKGVGLGKRAPSPGLAERAAKVLKEDEAAKHESFRDRARSAFEERKIMGQLSNAIKTLRSLDDKSGVQFNALALDPQDPANIPPELLEALAAATADTDDLEAGGNGRELSYDGLAGTPTPGPVMVGESEKECLRREMQRDALQPLRKSAPGIDDEDAEEEGFAMVANGSEKEKKNEALPLAFSEEAVSEARTFLQLAPGDRLSRVLEHLRSKYHYCLWCGTQYDDQEDLDSNCPGPDEDVHD